MADVRALLKAKRTERGTVTKPSKASLGRSTREHPHTLAQSKRKLDNDSEASQELTVLPNSTHDGKRRKVEEPIINSQPPPPAPSSSSGFPSDFFSDPSRTPHLGGNSDDEDDLPAAQGPSTSSQLTVDAEFEAFERAIVAASKPTPHPPDKAIYTRATVYADPELVEEVPEGFPESVVDHSSGNRPQPVPIPLPSGAGPAGIATEEESETEKQKRREQDERELIMDRLVDEERAQEDADARVNALKARLETIKKKREVVRAEKAKQKQPG